MEGGWKGGPMESGVIKWKNKFPGVEEFKFPGANICWEALSGRVHFLCNRPCT